jgi:magnesium transporter
MALPNGSYWTSRSAMLALYRIIDQRLIPVEPGRGQLNEVVWVDLDKPTLEEEAKVEELLGIDVPTREEMAEIETSSRLYREGDALYMTANLLVGAGTGTPASCPVTFILTADRLVTVRYAEPSVFTTFMKQVERADAELRNADSVFVSLIEAIIDRSADILEKEDSELDAIMREVLRNEAAAGVSRDYKTVLRRIALSGDITSKVRESLVSLGRLLNFLGAECGECHPGLGGHAETMAADIRSLSDHSTYMAGKSGFLLEATLGLINVEQNAIIKIVSVVSVLIMPPTLIASIYGMNFQFMPELTWRFGYPLAIAAMVLSAIIPFCYFKRRGWL